VVHEPRTLFSMMRRVPAGLAYFSGRNAASGVQPDSWPRRFTRLERRGLLYGPLAYAISRARGRRVEAHRLAP